MSNLIYIMAIEDGATYVIDPDGEVIILLVFASSSSAVCDEDRNDGQDATSRLDGDSNEGPSEGPRGTEEPSQKRTRLEDTKVSCIKDCKEIINPSKSWH